MLLMYAVGTSTLFHAESVASITPHRALGPSRDRRLAVASFTACR